jgi:TM2 domain-containing membrane protein YozV
VNYAFLSIIHARRIYDIVIQSNLLFCWTGIPVIVGFIEGILYLVKLDDEFRRQYG